MHAAALSVPYSTAGRGASVETDPLRNARLLVYLYVALWVFEGALRKWIVPGLSGPLLIIRDPIVVAIYIEAMRQKVFRFDTFIGSMGILAILATIISLGLPKTPPLGVVIFGFRANFLHLPLIFVLPRILEYRHVRMIGACFLWIAAPMALLVALQFISPQSRLNAGAGGAADAMIETAGGRIRPAGTFSFTNGMAGFAGIVGAFLLHQLLERGVFPRLAFLTAAPALMVMVLLSGSRTNFGLMILLLMAVMVIWVMKPHFVKSSLKFFAIGFVIFMIIGSFSILQVGFSVLAERFGDSKNVKEGFIMRFVSEFTKPLDTVTRAETFGVGIGMGTNAASSLMYGKVIFNLGESDYDRVIMEMGPLLGLAYIAWRMGAGVNLGVQSLGALRRESNTLPLLLTTACLPDLLQGQFGQTTTLGFACLTAGLALAATRRGTVPGSVVAEALPAAVSAVRRGQSAYSAMLAAEALDQSASRAADAAPAAPDAGLEVKKPRPRRKAPATGPTTPKRAVRAKTAPAKAPGAVRRRKSTNPDPEL